MPPRGSKRQKQTQDKGAKAAQVLQDKQKAEEAKNEKAAREAKKAERLNQRQQKGAAQSLRGRSRFGAAAHAKSPRRSRCARPGWARRRCR